MSPVQKIQDIIEVVSGNPTPEELAAVVAILEATHLENKSTNLQSQTTYSSWNLNASRLRGSLNPGAGQWQAHYRSQRD